MSLRSKVWVTMVLLCASMAAQAEYKEVWNPPEAARGAQRAQHAPHAKASAPHAKAVVAKPVAPAKTKAKSKSKSSEPHGAAVKSWHATGVKATHAKPSEAAAKPGPAAAKPTQAAASPAIQPGNGSTPRDLPPILH
ncbi:hypothetical protein PPMP20_23070 [Paraburkholderia phymatum]|uniref:hypothetical protein n=1 Tax=Paraburkholderia phymatum TaxID=148447 RepID=UPI00031BBB67|nr:hypothetical protein [Paraburkholderia phymatum]